MSSPTSRKESNKVDRYPWLVKAGNAALEFLKGVTHDGFRHANDELGILFYRNDPEGNPNASYFGPGVIITSLASARAAGRRTSNSTWENITKFCAPRAPNDPFQWRDVLSSVELSCVECELGPPPKSFEVMPDPVSHEENIYRHFTHKKKPAEPAADTGPSAKRTKETLSMSALVRPVLGTAESDPCCTCRNRTVSSTPHPPAGVESAMDVIMPQNSKKLPPIVRIGYYGAKMVGASLGASNSINLFIEGT